VGKKEVDIKGWSGKELDETGEVMGSCVVEGGVNCCGVVVSFLSTSPTTLYTIYIPSPRRKTFLLPPLRPPDKSSEPK
jgi:hypothetical protein